MVPVFARTSMPTVVPTATSAGSGAPLSAPMSMSPTSGIRLHVTSTLALVAASKAGVATTAARTPTAPGALSSSVSWPVALDTCTAVGSSLESSTSPGYSAAPESNSVTSSVPSLRLALSVTKPAACPRCAWSEDPAVVVMPYSRVTYTGAVAIVTLASVPVPTARVPTRTARTETEALGAGTGGSSTLEDRFCHSGSDTWL